MTDPETILTALRDEHRSTPVRAEDEPTRPRRAAELNVAELPDWSEL